MVSYFKILLFQLSALFVCAKNTAFAADFSKSALARVLAEDEFRKIMKATILTEDVLKGLRKEAGRDPEERLPNEPLRTHCAYGYCDLALDLTAHFLRLLGAKDSQIQLFHVDGPIPLVSREAIKHVILAYHTTEKNGKNIVVILDPTFTQYYGLINSLAEFKKNIKKEIDDPDGKSVQDILVQTRSGKKVLASLEKHGAWLVTEARLKAWAAAANYPNLPPEDLTITSLKTGNIGLSNIRIALRAQDWTQKNDREILNDLQNIDDGRIEKRISLRGDLIGRMVDSDREKISEAMKNVRESVKEVFESVEQLAERLKLPPVTEEMAAAAFEERDRIYGKLEKVMHLPTFQPLDPVYKGDVRVYEVFVVLTLVRQLLYLERKIVFLNDPTVDMSERHSPQNACSLANRIDAHKDYIGKIRTAIAKLGFPSIASRSADELLLP